MNNLKNGKTPGMDGIHGEFIKHLGPKGTKVLTRLFNKCLFSGDTDKLSSEIPAAWRCSLLVPIPKIDENGKQKGIRPIAICSSMGKTWERVICNRLVHHLESLDKLHDGQYGGRAARSAQDVFVILTQTIHDAWGKKRKKIKIK